MNPELITRISQGIILVVLVYWVYRMFYLSLRK